TPQHPSLYSQPRVRIVLDASGAPPKAPAQAIEIDLAHQRRRSGEPIRLVRRVVATSDDPSAASLRALAASGDEGRGQATPVPPPPAPPSREPSTPASPGARAEEPNTRAVSWDEQAKVFDAGAALMDAEPPAPTMASTAEGTLARTPFVHLLIY